MTQKAYVARVAGQPRVVAPVHGSGRTGLIQIGVHDHRSVENDGDVPSVGDHLLGVPLAGRSQFAPPGRYHPVDRTVVLVRLQLGVLLGVVVQDLQFHAHVGGVTLQRGADAQAVVGSRGEPELEAEDEVVVFGGGVQVPSAAAPLGIDHDHAVLNHVPDGVSDPAGQVAAVEQTLEALGHECRGVLFSPGHPGQLIVPDGDGSQQGVDRPVLDPGPQGGPDLPAQPGKQVGLVVQPVQGRILAGDPGHQIGDRSLQLRLPRLQGMDHVAEGP